MNSMWAFRLNEPRSEENEEVVEEEERGGRGGATTTDSATRSTSTKNQTCWMWYSWAQN